MIEVIVDQEIDPAGGKAERDQAAEIARQPVMLVPDGLFQRLAFFQTMNNGGNSIAAAPRRQFFRERLETEDER
jgi:hypothetical protein